jgi:hypothetical protein
LGTISSASQEAIEDLARQAVGELEHVLKVAVQGVGQLDDRLRGGQGVIILDTREVREGEAGGGGHVLHLPAFPPAEAADVLAERECSYSIHHDLLYQARIAL